MCLFVAHRAVRYNPPYIYICIILTIFITVKQCGKILSSKYSTIYELVTNEHRVTTIVNNPGPNDNKNQLEYENRMVKENKRIISK